MSRAIRSVTTHGGAVLRRGILAAALAVAISAALPQRWESSALVLPPTRRTDVFRYEPDQSVAVRGLQRMLRNLRLQDEAHPVEITTAIFESRWVASALVERLDLVERWRLESLEDAVDRVEDALTIEFVPFGGIEVRARATDPELARDLVNGAVELVNERTRELALAHARAEAAFVEDAQSAEDSEIEAFEEALASWRAAEGLAAPERQRAAALDAAAALQERLAAARVSLHRASRESGPQSAAARDARIRLERWEEAARTWPAALADVRGDDARRAELERAERASELLASLRSQTIMLPAGAVGSLRVLDPGIAAPHPKRTTWWIAALLAFALVPMGLVFREFLPTWRDRLRREARESNHEIFATWASALERRRPLRRPAADALAILAAGAAGVVLVQFPLVGAIAAAGVFLILLGTNLTAAWMLLVVTLPWAWEYTNSNLRLALLVPTEPAIALLLGAWAYVLALRGRWKSPRHPLLLAMAVTVGWMAITTIPSVHFRFSFFQMISTSGFMLAGAIFPMYELRTIASIERVVRVYLWSGVAISVFGIVQVATSPLPLDRAALLIGEGLLSNHGPYAAFLGFTLGPALVYLLMLPFDRRVVLPIACAVLGLLATFLSLSRAAWLATGALLAIIVFVKARTFLRTLLVPVAIGATLAILVLGSLPGAAERLENYVVHAVSARNVSNLERMNRWIAGVRMIVSNPLVGVGPGAFEAAYPAYREIEWATNQSHKNMGAHSEMLRAAAEQGIPGVLILGALVFVFYRSGLRLMRHPDADVRRLAAAICAGVFTYSVHSLFNEYWRFTKVALTMWVFVGLLGALHAAARDTGNGGGGGGALARPPES